MNDATPWLLNNLLKTQAAADPDRAALIIAEEIVTYQDLESAADHCAAGLQAAGAGPGTRVALAGGPDLVSMATLLGCPRIGAAAALMNPRLTSDELATLISVAGADALGVAGPTGARALAGALGRPVLGEDLLPTETAATRWPSVGPDDEAAILFTSGTTGTPKAVPLTHRLLSLRVAEFAPAFDASVPPAVTLMSVPLVHIGGMLGLFIALARGSTTVVLPRFDAGEWLRLVERHHVDNVFLVPTMLHRILDHPNFPTTDLSSLVLVSYGAAPAPPELIRRAIAALPHVNFSNTFGQTETLGSITALAPDDLGGDHVASVGRPLPGVEVRVVDPATGQDVPRGTVGELWVRTAASVIPEPSDQVIAPPPGWLRTGDVVRQDADGYLYPSGRLSDTINRGGEKFAPAEIEEVLRGHPAVRDVAVGGIADAEMGQRVGALVVPAERVSAEELRTFCRSRLANFKLPERIRFVEDIPYNDFGKVSRRRLAELLAEESSD